MEDEPQAGPTGGAPAKPRLHNAIARRLGVMIVAGDYKPGDLLDNEVASSEQLKVSRGAYREAMRILAAKGLVESRPKTGTRVSPQNRWRVLDPEVLAWMFDRQPSLDFLRSLFELRMIVEPAAAALAASRRGGEDIVRMRRALQDMERHTVATKEGRAADRAFHDAVLDATRNRALVSLSSSIGTAVAWTTVFKQRERALPRDPMPEHWKVFDAIALGDSEVAKTAMQELVAQALEDTRVSL